MKLPYMWRYRWAKFWYTQPLFCYEEGPGGLWRLKFKDAQICGFDKNLNQADLRDPGTKPWILLEYDKPEFTPRVLWDGKSKYFQFWWSDGDEPIGHTWNMTFRQMLKLKAAVRKHLKRTEWDV
jgi:hypothetical protein